MRILFVSHYSEVYGANQSLINLIEGLRNQIGIESFVLLPEKGPIEKQLSTHNIPYEIRAFHNWYHEADKAFNFRDALYKQRQNYRIAKSIAKLSKFNLVYSNSSATNFGLVLSKLLKIDHVWHIRELLEEHYNYKFDLPFWLVKIFFNVSKKIIAISETVAELKYLPQNKVQVVYNGVTYEKDVFIKDTFKKDIITIGQVGLIHPSKNQIEAVTALQELRSFYNLDKIVLKIIGGADSTYLDSLNAYISDNRMSDCVLITGYIPLENLYDDIDILISCSRGEGLGRTIIEAMCKGITVVGINDGGIGELINHKKNGLVYQGNSQDLASQISWLINNKAEREQMIINANIEARNNFTIEALTKKVLDIIKH